MLLRAGKVHLRAGKVQQLLQLHAKLLGHLKMYVTDFLFGPFGLPSVGSGEVLRFFYHKWACLNVGHTTWIA